jgi:ABC-type nitrate/sulfonate/bicarbonate transport system permease component
MRIASIFRFLEPALVVVFLLALWEVLARTGVLFQPSLPPPTRISQSLATDIQTRYLWESVWLTMKAWAVALGIVIVVAVPLGVALGLSSVASRATILSFEFVRAIPSIAALPILILLYGTGFKLTVILAILGALWPLLIQTMYGVQDVDPVARDTARVYGLGRIRRFRLVVLPSAAPYIGTGLRLSGVITMILVVAATLIVGGGGLGAAIASAEQTGHVPLVFDRIFVTAVIGLMITLGLTAIERRLLRWHPSMRSSR